MNEIERAELKEYIRRNLNELRDDITALEKLVAPIAPDNAIGRLSRMEAISAKSINEANLTKARTRLEKLKAALGDLENDPDFGLCIECGEDIPMGRIRLMPESRMCVQCAGKYE